MYGPSCCGPALDTCPQGCAAGDVAAALTGHADTLSGLSFSCAPPLTSVLQVVAVIEPEMQVTQVAANPWDESALALAAPGGVRTCRVDVNTGSVRSSPLMSTQVGVGRELSCLRSSCSCCRVIKGH